MKYEGSDHVCECLMLMQYMVLYQLLMALMFNTSFFMDGSHFNNQQVSSATLLVHNQPRAEGLELDCCQEWVLLRVVSVVLTAALDCT